MSCFLSQVLNYHNIMYQMIWYYNVESIFRYRRDRWRGTSSGVRQWPCTACMVTAVAAVMFTLTATTPICITRWWCSRNRTARAFGARPMVAAAAAAAAAAVVVSAAEACASAVVVSSSRKQSTDGTTANNLTNSSHMNLRVAVVPVPAAAASVVSAVTAGRSGAGPRRWPQSALCWPRCFALRALFSSTTIVSKIHHNNIIIK